MSHNSFGHLFRVTTFGESHGPAIGCIVDGTPPGIAISTDDIQADLDRRKPGQSRFTTQRKESDTVEILSGTLDGVTTGTPIALLIRNEDQRSKDYDAIKDQFRPGHADFTYVAKYGLRDHRGGGRSSARETATRVAAGAIARKIIASFLGGGADVQGALVRIGEHEINRENWDWSITGDNPFFAPDPAIVPVWTDYLDGIRKDGSSVGAVIEVQASGIPAGIGAPLYGKLDSDLAAAMMTINAVKGVEIGAGMQAAELRGEENADQIRTGDNGEPVFLSNHAGGVLGGISTGQDIVVRFSVKPTSSILTPRQSIDSNGNEIDIMTKGRHDPCVGIRAVPVGEAMMACVLADHLMRHRAQCG